MGNDDGLNAVPLNLAQLWMSFLMHELISPIGAINNGIELIEESPEYKTKAMGGDETIAMAFDLIKSSGIEAANRLKYYRLAFGRSGSSSDIGIDAGITLAKSYFSQSQRVVLNSSANFPDGYGSAQESGLWMRGVEVQLWMNLLLLGANCLQRGGEIAIGFRTAPQKAGFRIDYSGKVAQLQPVVRDLLTNPNQKVIPDNYNCVAILCVTLAKIVNMKISIASQSIVPNAAKTGEIVQIEQLSLLAERQ